MQIHELNNFTGTLGSGAYLAIDDGNDTGKISKTQLFAATEARIDNIIAGPAPSAEEIVDARLGADGVTYPSLGDAIRDQFTDLKSEFSEYADDVSEFITPINYFTNVGAEADKILAADGSTTSSGATGYSTTDYLPISYTGRLMRLYYNTSHGYGAFTPNESSMVSYAFYRADKSLISAHISAWQKGITPPSGTKYLRFTQSNASFTYEMMLTYDVVPTEYSEYFAPYYITKVDESLDATSEKPLSNNAIVSAFSNYYNTKEVATSDFDTLAPYDTDDDIVGFTTINKNAERISKSTKIVAVNHDDLPLNDYTNTRRIYNKYGFNANFNFILKPFANTTERDDVVANVKKLIADGHTLGLHAIFNESFWWMNKMYDIAPDYSSLYAPTLSELQTVDSNGKNVFGYTITAGTKVSQAGFVDAHNNLKDVLVLSMTNAQKISLIGWYTLFAHSGNISGLDLDGKTVSKTMLGWLEYWYNNLIDSTLGYTAGSGIDAMYAQNYSVPVGGTASEYYPDVSHLASGKIVKHDDTTNPNYSNAEYKKVGYFTSGLFKGASTTCNYEVIERCIEVAKAFCKHYFGTDILANYGRHGVMYSNCLWKNGNGVSFDNGSMSILSGGVGRVYNTRKERFETGQDILLNQGIKMTSYGNPITPAYMGMSGLYYGQHNYRYPYFNVGALVNYLTLMGTTASFDGNTTDSDVVNSILGEAKDPLKFCYENAGTQVTDSNSNTLYVHNDLKLAIDHIRATFDTGRIPALSLDTIINDASNAYAVELLCQYCFKNDIRIVPFEEARQIAESSDVRTRGNYFPNPKFSQSLLDLFGGSSASADASIPDGWSKYNVSGNASYSVTEGSGNRYFNIVASGTGYVYLSTSIYGLPSGRYKFSCYAKQTVDKAHIYLYNNLNMTLTAAQNQVAHFAPTSEYVKYEYEFDISEPSHRIIDNTPASQSVVGYQNNLNCIRVQLGFSLGTNAPEQTFSIYAPKIEKLS